MEQDTKKEMSTGKALAIAAATLVGVYMLAHVSVGALIFGAAATTAIGSYVNRNEGGFKAFMGKAGNVLKTIVQAFKKTGSEVKGVAHKIDAKIDDSSDLGSKSSSSSFNNSSTPGSNDNAASNTSKPSNEQKKTPGAGA